MKTTQIFLRHIIYKAYRLILVFLILFSFLPLNAQYFSRNKPSYKVFEFDVLNSPNFEIYHYIDNDTLIDFLAQGAEEWYSIHQKVFADTFIIRNPLIFYNDHSDFQQTNTISGLLGTGTGGVTESLKNRVIMPVAPTLAQTDHVLGHELVHAFQFNMFNVDSNMGLNMNNLPLWMVEGMAEYLSIGSVDPNTAMWMRDALMINDFPTLKKMSSDYSYFPYRFGHAFWSMVGKTWGDSVILPIFRETARFGYDRAFRNVLGINEENLSSLWKSAMEVHYSPYLSDTVNKPTGNMILSEHNSGPTNISPSLSPDGRLIAFFSQKNVFTLDLYLADAGTGKIIKKLSSVLKNSDIDDFSSIESGGTWSPDSKQFAFVIFSKGVNKLAIVDVSSAKIINEIELPGVASISTAAWSPDGESILVSGSANGINDLYLYMLANRELKRLTYDFNANIHPAWSPDGRYIVYATENIQTGNNGKKYSFDLVIFDAIKGITVKPEIFPGADNLNPQYSPDGKSIYFLSNRDGFRNMYSYDTESGKISQMTAFPTGISGITAFAPALSVAQESGLIAYTYYYNSNHQIYTANPDEFMHIETDANEVDFSAGTLPPLNHIAYNIVDSSLYNRVDNIPVNTDSFSTVSYKPKFQLDAISNAVQTDVSAGRYGTNMAGSVSMSFSDILGNNQLFSALSLNGEIYDFGIQAAYVNQKRKLKFGGIISHIPTRYGTITQQRDSITYNGERIEVYNLALDNIRMFEDNISLFAFYPFSQTRRVEAGISTSWYYYRYDRYNNYYSDYGYFLGSAKEKLDSPEGFNLQQVDVAYVKDNSYFGMTAPLQGQRARLQIIKNFGILNFYSALLDYRQYFFMKPLSFAFRLYHYGRYGSTSNSNIISPVFLGYPWMIRGYDSKAIYNKMGYEEVLSFNTDLLYGSRIAVANAEIRIPLTGPEQLALIKSKWVGSDFNLFFDGGIAWDTNNKPVLQWDTEPGKRTPVFSTGVSFRFNLLGAIVLETYYAFPFQNGGFQNGSFGLNITQGW